MNVEEKLKDLKTRLLESSDLGSAAAVLGWDQSTYMPPGGAPYRARQMALLYRLAHERFTDPAIGRLLDDLEQYGEGLDYHSDDAALLRVTRRQFERLNRVPSEFVAEMSAHSGMSYQLWTEARPANDFKKVEPMLEKTLDLSRRYAEFFPHDHIADPLIDDADYGMKAADVRAVFAQLREALVPIVAAITAQDGADDSCLKQHFPGPKQLEFGLSVAKDYGYDLNRGRQDLTHHPFATKFGWGDVRITTRVQENDLGDALFSTLHEAGHAMYEQGINATYNGTPLDGGTSAGVHESQSRLWENVVGRSRPFWENYYPKLQATFPDQLGSVPLETFYRAINTVQRSLIRVDADEVTYNLHVMLRFDLGLDLLEGKLAVRDLPEAWHAHYQNDLGVRAPSDVDGVLQDVHWYGGLIGGSFQGYTLGNIMSLQFYNEALKQYPEIPAEIGQGKFDKLHGWLKENIYQYGSKYAAPELLQRVTGGGLNIEPYIQYLKTKYGALYRL
ncbi:MAG: carboxypeptidase M32 [bacterium]|nr:carboxypeptidase M32 [bacterium]